ncbi:zinc ribbon domain-containing protein, partial [Micromonospora sp. CB01531]|uniref:zinc ribbon domain-containing protein n=1 Tax=Micromonospora sp. CB01531 TaxID=1718947 RepID=UPI003FD46E6C
MARSGRLGSSSNSTACGACPSGCRAKADHYQWLGGVDSRQWIRRSPPGRASSIWKTCGRWKHGAWVAHNARLSQQVRGKIVDRMCHLAAETGVAVVVVPARNTSKLCPQCRTLLQHREAHFQPTVAGWKWVICSNQSCRWQGDRDHGSWRRIAARGLTHEARNRHRQDQRTPRRSIPRDAG